jgi:VWFA-related protein
MDGNAPVMDLTAADFELRSDRIVQSIEYLATSETPVDLTLVVDTSLAVGHEHEIDRFRQDLERLTELLGPDDRVRVVAFASDVRELMPLTPAHALPPPPPLVRGGAAALDDAVATALIASRNDGRRQLVAVLAAGIDNASGTDTGRVLDLAGRSHAVLHTYILDRTPVSGLRDFEPRSRVQRQQALEQAAERTGGRPHSYKNSAFGSLRDLLEAFRHSYVLYFRPSHAADRAWHDLSVEVRSPGGRRYTVRARPGYSTAQTDGRDPVAGPNGAEAGRSTPTPSEPGTPIARTEVTAGSMSSRFERYERGAHAEVAGELRRASNGEDLPRLIRREGQRWIEASPPGAAPRRRVVVAALALEVARPAHGLPGAAPTSEPPFFWRESFRLILWGGALLAENVAVADAERAWYLAAIASLQGMRQFNRSMAGWREAAALLDRAIVRDPDEGRHRWTYARLLEYRREEALRARVTVRLAELKESATSYEAAASRGDDDLRAEIQLHIVSRFLEANRDRDEPLGPIVDAGRREAAKEALARIAFAEGLADERFLIYICRFLRARIYDRLDRRPEAEVAYRSALEIYPQAQSASMALATLLFLRGEERAARQLVDAALASASTGVWDPWGLLYPHQDYRRLPMYIDQMRAALGAGR